MNEPNPVPYTAPQEPSIGMPSSSAFTTPTQSVEPVQAQVPSAVLSEQTEPGVPEHISPISPISPIAPISPEVESAIPSASPQVSSVSNVSEPATPSIIDPLTHQIPADLTQGVLEKSQYFNNSIFWIELEKIVPNPYQPRKEFDMHALKDLADSIRMYGLLQPLTVTRREVMKEDGGLAVQYELISGERRLRASGIAGLKQVPVIIRAGQEDPRIKLELAIIENLQREDLNPVDRARSFDRLANEFGLKHAQIADKMGKSREYVTNSLRILALPAHIIDALSEKKITEGHTRPLLMLNDRPEEQEVLFREIMFRKMTVREAEKIARGVATEKVRKHDQTPELKDLERQLNEALGTRVFIEKKEKGGKVVIDFFNVEDVRHILDMLSAPTLSHKVTSVKAFDSVADMMNDLSIATPLAAAPVQSASAEKDIESGIPVEQVEGAVQLIDDSTAQDATEDEDMYSVKGFSI
ncbi:MAG: chromosome partitioning protein ParB, chromosome partitioning protein ParB family [Candidatus Parcubacteria bacterium]|jgi:ParB family chromosome partitioning protein